ncbi:PQQ-dependent sugar dehydrogenase [Amycolatopsis nigrescens]|uniref:PQQ-dependent sugar dehydrogenase n=1 Tax=Amycolatopsis nigrescens TaxID=381445 RepID=UPI0003A29D46|nr:PQQ-dependent sugar dehydrogenase [Amycolatopsis nigrescens]
MSKPRWSLVTVMVVVLVAFGVAPPALADTPVTDPIPQDPVVSGLGIQLEEFAALPKSETTPPTTDDRLKRWARINYLGQVPDHSGRLFVPDLNGKLYLLEDGKPREYLDVGGTFAPDFYSGQGLGSGFGFVAFDPGFAWNGRFYTVHTEGGAGLQKPTDLPPQPGTTVHGVITEWTASDPAAKTFSGTHREVLRLGFYARSHGIQQIDFNPTARQGSPEHGLLYVTVGDGGRGVTSTEPQDLGTPYGKILRIDPRGTNGPSGRYGIPARNPFTGKPGARGEIYAYGMRDPHRFSWDPAAGDRMFLGHIGEHDIEAVYEVRAGDNLGWSEREGPFVFDRDDRCNLYPLPADDEKYGYTYPVAAYDHNAPPDFPCNRDSGHAISGGFVYRGHAVPELRGKYVFADLVNGRVFYTEAAEMRRGRPMAAVHELMIYDKSGNRVTTAELAGDARVDLRFGVDARGELYALSKANGKVWKVTGARQFASCDAGADRVTNTMGARNWAPVTPSKWRFPGDAVVLAEAGEARPGPRRPFEYAVLTKGPEFASARIDARVRLDTPVEITNRDVIIVFGYRSDTEFYYAHLSTDNKIYPHNGIFLVHNADRLRLDDQWDPVRSKGASPAITDANWHQVRVTHCAGSGEIAVYVDGSKSPLMTAVDKTLGSGRVGFGSFDNIGSLRELKITGEAVR